MEDLSDYGFKVKWDGDNRTISADDSNNNIGNNESYTDGSYDYANPKFNMAVNGDENSLVYWAIPSVEKFEGMGYGNNISSDGNYHNHLIQVTFKDNYDLNLTKFMNKQYFPIRDKIGNDISDEFEYVYKPAIDDGYDIDINVGGKTVDTFPTLYIIIKSDYLSKYLLTNDSWQKDIRLYFPNKLEENDTPKFTNYVDGGFVYNKDMLNELKNYEGIESPDRGIAQTPNGTEATNVIH